MINGWEWRKQNGTHLYSQFWTSFLIPVGNFVKQESVHKVAQKGKSQISTVACINHLATSTTLSYFVLDSRAPLPAYVFSRSLSSYGIVCCFEDIKHWHAANPSFFCLPPFVSSLLIWRFICIFCSKRWRHREGIVTGGCSANRRWWLDFTPCVHLLCEDTSHCRRRIPSYKSGEHTCLYRSLSFSSSASVLNTLTVSLPSRGSALFCSMIQDLL